MGEPPNFRFRPQRHRSSFDDIREMPMHRDLPLGFRLWMAALVVVIVCAWIGVGFALYRLGTDPEGVGNFAGRVIGSAIDGATGGRRAP